MEEKVIAGKFGEEKGELPGRERIRSVMATIGEHIFLLGMCMQVQEHLHSSVIQKYVPLDVVHFLAAFEFRPLPAPVQVIPCQIASGIAQNDAIRVGHRDHLQDVLLEQAVQQVRTMLFSRIINEKSIDFIEYSLDYMRSGSLDGVSAGHDEDHLLIVDGEMQRMGYSASGEGQHLHSVIQVCGAQLSPLEIYYIVLILLVTGRHFVEKSTHTRIAVGLIVRDINFLS